MPGFDDRQIGLSDIAELCRRQALARPGRDWAVVRSQILTIGCEWDLDRDRLEDQPDDCLHHLIVFLEG